MGFNSTDFQVGEKNVRHFPDLGGGYL